MSAELIFIARSDCFPTGGEELLDVVREEVDKEFDEETESNPSHGFDALRMRAIGSLKLLHPSYTVTDDMRGSQFGCTLQDCQDKECWPSIEFGVASALICLPTSFFDLKYAVKTLTQICHAFEHAGFVCYDPQTDRVLTDL